ncbi:MAG: sigma-54-dependent Fis family transcriptional regulator [Gemmatimonadetes bacterium]|nr:sigma-54-dependent Fis family transcriptional regulator [Gemmatimonadota bacterium]
MSTSTAWTDNPRVLAVDDEQVVCEAIRRVLEEEGYQVTTTTSARAGLELIRKESFDLLLLDIKMPEVSGIEFLREARSVSPDTEAIIVTGYATIETAVEAIKLGAFDYLEKPVSPPQLVVVAARALERRQLLNLTRQLRSELETRHRIGNVIVSSPRMRKVMQLVAKVAPASSTVLITGETGTGKDVIARAIHYNSPRKDAPFVVADCAALSESLLESELFGHVRGAFTGAVRDRKGLAEAARGGTLFLDEISTISPQVQGSLLRLIQEHEIRPVGADRTVSVDVRLIAATNRELQELVREGKFREDLFYRLSVFTINLPPLRERREEIPFLAHHFVHRIAEELGKEIDGITPQAMAVLEAHDWPGNVRELENVMERAVLLADSRSIGPDTLPLEGDNAAATWAGVPDDAATLVEYKKELRLAAVERLERLFVLKALRSADWNVSAAARAVGMQRPNFHALMRKYGITARDTGPDGGDEDSSES